MENQLDSLEGLEEFRTDETVSIGHQADEHRSV
jgi:hypothetical protein